jgi:hypothetical protein
MSNFRHPSGEDYPDAAGKHYTDARALMKKGRYDGAAYLAGYVVECILKTIIQVDRGNNDPIIKFRHDLNKLSNEALHLAALPSSKTARYFSRGSLTILQYADPPAGWKETLRYRHEGTIPKTTAADWVAEAKRLYMLVIGGLRKDGEVVL